MVIAAAHRYRPLTDQRNAVQIALVFAIAAHIFFAVWVLRRVDTPANFPVPPLILVNLHPASSAPSVKASPVHARTMIASVHKPRGPTRAPDSGRPATEPRRENLEGNTAVGAASISGARMEPGPSYPGGRGTGVAGGQNSRFVPPKVLHHAPGDYPESAFRANAEGRTQVLVTVDAGGRLVDATVAFSSGTAALDTASLEVVRHYVFKAGERDGVAAQMDAYIDIGWTITPAVIRRYASSESLLALPPGLAAKRAPTRIGSWMETAKKDAAEAGQ